MLKFYEITPDYIDYLSAFAPHLFHNKTATQVNKRIVYSHKIANGDKTQLAMRCNDFLLLESKCVEWAETPPTLTHPRQSFTLFP